MRYRTYLVLFAICIAVIFIHSSFQHGSKGPCDAPSIGSAHSGAPGEVTCATIGCHSGTANTGPGGVLVDLGVPGNIYTPGQTYTATIAINDTGLNKFGFQVTILEDSTNTSSGALTITDAVNTHLIPDVGREYVGNTPCGADADTVGELTWTFDWQAPVTSEGNLTAYISALATNHNHFASGDNTYTETIQLTPEIPVGINGMATEGNRIRIYPNPTDQFLHMQFDNPGSEKANIVIANSLGQHISSYVLHRDGHLKIKTSHLPDGIYTVSVNNQFYRKIVVAH